tara:strand:+ start:24650 stop:24841 length:192 start_codon:yes stop_codon:yes gene_type:complete
MDETTNLLINLVKETTALKVSTLLGHDTTQKVERWVRNKSIPSSQIGTVSQIFKLNKIEKEKS